MLKRFLRWLGFFPPPIEMRCILGVTQDGRYILRTSDGQITLSPKLTGRVDAQRRESRTT